MERKYTGIILGKYDIGEADRLYAIFTLEEGKIKAKAVGVRKAAARLAAALENFNLVDVSIMKKQGPGNITSAIVENNYPRLKNDLDKLARVFESVRIFESLSGESVRDRHLFGLLRGFLETMNNLETSEYLKIEILNQGFRYKLLQYSGYKFEVRTCVSCGAKLDDGQNFFSASQGGVQCQKCASAENRTIKIGKNSIKLMRLFFTNSLKSLTKIRAEKKDIDELKAIINVFLEWIKK